SATADLNDENMVDIYHEIAYGKRTTNYNRDIQAFPIVREMLTRIYGKSPYNSPTDMGVNMAGFAIEDDAKVQEASKQEIIRRLFDTKIDYANGTVEKSAIEKIEKIMRYLNLDVNDRDVYKAAIKREEETGQTSAAMQFEDGSIVTSKTSSLFGCASALILNALKHVSNISKEIDVLSISVLEPIQQMKVESLGHRNPHLHIDETLIALAISAQTSPVAKLVFDNLNKLNGAEAHFTCKLSKGDEQTLKRLKVNFTTEPDYEDNRLAND
ncbi:MAG: DUF1846 family protein, partial [Bacilli bacterium]|nr:DUF1846 family protein [Bacilli bacterium]